MAVVRRLLAIPLLIFLAFYLALRWAWKKGTNKSEVKKHERRKLSRNRKNPLQHERHANEPEQNLRKDIARTRKH